MMRCSPGASVNGRLVWVTFPSPRVSLSVLETPDQLVRITSLVNAEVSTIAGSMNSPVPAKG